MEAEERNRWISNSVKYLRLVADEIESIVITTRDHDTITFQSREDNE